MFFSILAFLAGLLLFLLGMNLIKQALELLTLAKIKNAIKKFTATPLKGMFTGMVTTFVIQSSSAISVITISLVNSGLMTLNQAIGIILGTNIGTCLTALLFTFDILKYYPVIALVGLILLFIKNRIFKSSGVTLIGFSLVFWGLILMQKSFLPLKNNSFFLNLLTTIDENYLTGIIAGAIFTAIIQSSSVVTGIVIALSLQDLINLPGAIVIILGSNIGTCVTALLASITVTKNAKRVAYAHVLLNFLGVVIFYPLITPFVTLLMLLTPDLPAQIAWGQIIFNVICSFMALPFTNQIEKILTNL